ncbi:MAG: hypothetical protein JXR76_24630 [Deltaproteobacteria bacterium]|nr:hypothetical protein [Deltaproteobacteria bacterium]
MNRVAASICLWALWLFPVVTMGAEPIAHRFIAADEGAQQVLLVDENDGDAFWATPTPGGNRDMQLIGDNRLLVSRQSGGYFELDINTGEIVKEVSLSLGDTQTVRRLLNGNTIVAGDNLNGGQGTTMVELDTDDKVIRSVSFPGTGTTRVVRRTAADTFLFGYDKRLLEGNWNGDILMDHTIDITDSYGPYMTVRRLNGNTVTATGYFPALHEYAPDGSLVATIGGRNQNNAKDINPNFYAGFQILENDNIVVTNWQGHGNGHGNEGTQLLEYSPDGALVWSWHDEANPPRFSSLHGVIILDTLDTTRLHDDINGVLSPVRGCTFENAPNYNPFAIEDDDSCEDDRDTQPDSDTVSDSDADTATDEDVDSDTLSGADGDADTDADGDTDSDADGDSDSDTDGDSDMDGDADGDSDADGEGDSDGDADANEGANNTDTQSDSSGCGCLLTSRYSNGHPGLFGLLFP